MVRAVRVRGQDFCWGSGWIAKDGVTVRVGVDGYNKSYLLDLWSGLRLGLKFRVKLITRVR